MEQTAKVSCANRVFVVEDVHLELRDSDRIYARRNLNRTTNLRSQVSPSAVSVWARTCNGEPAKPHRKYAILQFATCRYHIIPALNLWPQRHYKCKSSSISAWLTFFHHPRTTQSLFPVMITPYSATPAPPEDPTTPPTQPPTAPETRPSPAPTICQPWLWSDLQNTTQQVPPRIAPDRRGKRRNANGCTPFQTLHARPSYDPAGVGAMLHQRSVEPRWRDVVWSWRRRLRWRRRERRRRYRGLERCTCRCDGEGRRAMDSWRGKRRPWWDQASSCGLKGSHGDSEIERRHR